MEIVTSTLKLDKRLNGPSGIANGGFASGSIAQNLGGTVSVRLTRPIPLEEPLKLEMDAADFSAEVTDTRRRIVAEARRVEPFTMTPAVKPTFADAEAARAASPLHNAHTPFWDCVVCGPGRPDGLKVTPGPLANRREFLAAPFVPHRRDTIDDVVNPIAIWGALDCPSYPAASLLGRRIGLLGTLAAHQNRDVILGEKLVAVGWTLEHHGRSTRTASALLDEGGTVVASARAVWVELRHQWLMRLGGRLAVSPITTQ